MVALTAFMMGFLGVRFGRMGARPLGIKLTPGSDAMDFSDANNSEYVPLLEDI